MKRTTLTPPLKSLKIAIASAILGLGAMSGANAQLDSIEKKLQQKFQGLDDNKIAALKKDDTFSILSLMMAANTLTIDEINKDVIKNNNSIQDLDDEMNFLSEDITSLNDDVADIQANIAENNDSIDDLYEANNENVERLIEHDRAIQILAEAGNHHDDLIRNLYAFSNHQEEYALRQTDEIENLIQASSANTDRISTAELGIAENKKDALIAKAQADKNRNHIKELAKAQLESVTFLGEQIQENKDDIANNINNIYELAQQQDQHSSDIKTLAKASAANKADADAKFKGVQTDIANNKITLANHAKKINDNQKAIEAKLGGKVDAQKLVDLETKVDDGLKTVQENYSQLNTQVQSVDNKIGMVDTRINALDDKVENSMAAQAALNGLFQPYNVGKVSVSAAVGAYGSKSAIAVGAGYRVNPHLAFKGGAAINTSGSRKGSYNLGINYEF